MRKDSPIVARRTKLADLTSGTGALVLGFGLGLWLSPMLHRAWIASVVVGGALHAWGMLDKHRIERTAAMTVPRWSTALYWICWLLLIGLAGVLLAR